MITGLIDWIVRARWMIGLAVVAGVIASVYAVRTAPLDAIPDTSDPQVIIYAKWPMVRKAPQLRKSLMA